MTHHTDQRLSSPRPIVILGGPPYQPSANQTSLQMFDRLSETRTAIYVCRQYQGSRVLFSTRGRNRSARDVLAPGLHQIGPTAYVLVAPFLVNSMPLVHPEFTRRYALRKISHAIDETLRRLELQSPDVLAYWWMFPELVASARWTRRVFDVVDRHWGYAYLKSARVRDRNLELAISTARASDATICVSRGLADELATHEVRASVVPNGVSLNRFRRIRESDISSSKRNIAIYVGGWNDRIDYELLDSMIGANVDWEFWLAGGQEAFRFDSHPNVVTYGNLDYDEAIALMTSARVGLIPFKSNNFTTASNFMKALDYLAAGALIAASDMPSMQGLRADFPHHVHTLRSLDDWTALFERLETELSDIVPPDLSNWSDSHRAAILSDLLSNTSGGAQG